MQDPDAELAAAELLPETPLDYSGKWVRSKVKGDRGAKKSGSYRLREYVGRKGKRLYWGCCHNFKTGEVRWIEPDPKEQRSVDAETRAEITRQREADQVRLAEERAELVKSAAERSTAAWANLPELGKSDYLQRKKVRAFGVRFSRGTVAVPVRNAAGELVGIQWIDGDGAKRFTTGTPKSGAWHLIGSPATSKVILIAEGYATAASLHMASKYPVAVAFDCSNLPVVARALRELHPEHRFLVACDDDWLQKCRECDQPTAVAEPHCSHCGKPHRQKNAGATKGPAAAESIGATSVVVRFKDGQSAGCTDFNDLHVREGLGAVRAQVEAALREQPAESSPARSEARGKKTSAPETSTWRKRLRRTKDGDAKPDIGNVVSILENDPPWKGVLAFCDFSYRVIKRKPPPFRDGAVGEWSDTDTTRLRVWMAESYGCTPKTSDVDEAVVMAAQANRFHPVKAYLEGLTWDGVPRIDRWLSEYLGAPETPYTRRAGRYWLIAAAARVMCYPVKADCVLIFEGPQGLGKSTAFAILGGTWYSDTHFALGEKDGYQQMCGVWICELAELDSFNKAESTRAKSFFSSRTDRYRPPYGRRPVDMPRQCVFGGTTNQDSYLKDSTGNRRYWPVSCDKLDAVALEIDRNDLWAEAVELFRKGERWWPGDDEGEMFREEQEQRFQADSWEDLILEHLAGSTIATYTVADLAKDALKMDPYQLKPPEEQRIGRIMTRLGWVKARSRELRGLTRVRLWVYRRPPGWTGETEE